MYQIKAWKKNRQGQANARKRRSQAKDGMKSFDKDYSDTDTSSYTLGARGNCDNIKIVFFKKVKVKKHQTDTFVVGFRQPGNEIHDLSEVQIRSYLFENGRDHLMKIKLLDCDNSNRTEANHHYYLLKASKISAYLQEKKIPKKMIELE